MKKIRKVYYKDQVNYQEIAKNVQSDHIFEIREINEGVYPYFNLFQVPYYLYPYFN